MRIYIYFNIISFNCKRKLRLRDMEMTDRNNYYFLIEVLNTKFKICFQNNRPS